MINKIIKYNKLLKTAKVFLLFLLVLFTFSCKKSEVDKYKKYMERVDNTKRIDKNIIKEIGGKDYIVDINGKEQEILDNVFDATVGEVAYFGECGKAKIPFVVVRRKKEFIEIMSIPKFNLMREESSLTQNKMATAESYSLLNTVFLKTYFSDEEIKNIIPFEYIEGNLQIEPDKKILEDFDIVYDQNFKDKYANPIIYSKILLHEQYVNRLYNDDYTKEYDISDEKNLNLILDSIKNMWNVSVTNNVKGITYKYDYMDFVYQSGFDFYKYNSRIELRLKNIETDIYKSKANGFKYIATSSDLKKEDYGYYYLQDGKIVKNEIIPNNNVKYYLSDTGKAIDLNKFSIQNVNGTNICICDDAIIRNKIISQNEISGDDKDKSDKKYFVDINGVAHNLISDIKDADTSDTVEFGHKSDNVDEPLLWRVVENLDGVYTLILENKIALDIINFNIDREEFEKREQEDSYDGKVNEYDTSNTWDASDRRKYLNEVFYKESFSENEKKIIVNNPIRAEAYLYDKTFGGIGENDVYDKVFVYNGNTKEYLKNYEKLFDMLKIKLPKVYAVNEKEFNFSLIDNNVKSIRPWIVVNITEKDVPEEKNSTDFVNSDTSEQRVKIVEIPKIANKYFYTIKLGKFLQFGDKETNINWHLMCIDGDTAYYKASQVLDFEEIIENKNEEVKWSNSKLRERIKTFIYETFTSDEIAYLEKIKKKYNYIDKNGNLKEEECEDIVTLLNYDEVPIYLTTGVHLSNKSFEKINNIDRKIASAVTSLFDNRSHKFYSACYNADDVGNSLDKKIEIKVNGSDYVGILPVIAISIDNAIKLSVNKKVKNNIDKKDELIKEAKDSGQYLFKNGLYGDTVKMGKYKNKDLEWVVLDRRREYALVIAKQVLYSDNLIGRYNTSSWKTSNVREKLNTEIFTEIFSEDEKKRIAPVKVLTDYTEGFERTKDMSKEELDNGYDFSDETTDYLFLPVEEDIKIIAKLPLKTAYNEMDKIWFRNGDMNGFFAGNFREVFDLNVNRKNKKYGIRPLMWIKYD